ncbi:DNA adenine methylase [Onishia taeanensis]|uniref:site-specific DNA-methyltransferase (adenine-specific) n=1 Tax=Onishia taeanensis TaxID=284577 RepID=A0A1G7NEY6_9GAMM|nr:DNA adenine methylase [Halomonas taeanensis]SDF72491.1 DNA adenine methylase [Halomonas taeanensis]
MTAKPIIPWIGGKRRLAKHILPLFPEHVCYVEPFVGAGALFFMKEPSKSEVLNDINGELINLYRIAKYHLEELYKEFKWAMSSRQQWDWLQVTPPETLTDVQRAARFLYLQKLAFGGKVNGQSFGSDTTSRPRFNLFSLEHDLSEAHMRLAEATLEHLSWERAIAKYARPHTLFYCDPPYWKTEGYGVEFGFEHYERLAELMATVKGKILVSINDHPDIRRVFAGFDKKPLRITYTAGGGKKAKPAGELLIANFELECAA